MGNNPEDKNIHTTEKTDLNTPDGHSNGGHRHSSSGHHHSSSEHHHSGSEHHHSSSGEHRHSSSGHSHSSSGRHHSSSGHSHSSSGHSHSSSNKSKSKSKINLFKRIKHRVKVVYWKAEHRFKKANKVKKAGYIVVFISILILIAAFTKAALTPTVPVYEDTTEAQTTLAATTSVVTTIPPIVDAPEVSTYYQINDTYKVNNDFTSGFLIMLPYIDSNEPQALKINADIDILKEKIRKKYNSVNNVKDFREFYDYSYDSFSKGHILFISVFTKYQTPSNEPVESNLYYAYDFTKDILVDDSVIPILFNLNDTVILESVNRKLSSVGAIPIETTDSITYYVRDKGAVWADVKVKALLGNFYYHELVQLTKPIVK